MRNDNYSNITFPGSPPGRTPDAVDGGRIGQAAAPSAFGGEGSAGDMI